MKQHHLRSQVCADPLQDAIVPDLIHVLWFVPPDSLYPSAHEYAQCDPTYDELLQDILPWDGADGVDGQVTTVEMLQEEMCKRG